ncbi:MULTISPECIES: aminomethyl-transferring glycine dehydrogenase [Corynebacterium]|uniref:aminomethyl-transferring glycine dehydrogenase n=1 Tax=Corynebacterium TaxID=1716 RepID=UPI001EF4CA41|nr:MULTISPECIES: aminomethyl-transferring glycine dehydrogenase [Corynebacterium]MCG7243735.1 aminomethyl-transferring glycine dehydrogenase [Corynebacterium sp. ACRPS]MCG7271975.1 aminomethyl-transferring glycine dehydrogenase [Corynebacterium sp. ACRQM]MCG7234180.1 aminomethyl-transferring glycine dehydrogenase [Corynebacterium sp. ACRPR]MDK8474214.1 aminomethyl-transferring glycine dehydrogenase [Corynebacterium sp. MSK078]MDK8659635.1 aminomethyl-transferring glycine dehydrogenase [Coryneb
MDYISRHLGPDSAEQSAMLGTVGYDSVQALVDAAIPPKIRAKELPHLPEALSEDGAQAALREFANQNTVLKPFYGQGYSDTLTPAVIRRGLLEDAGWYTAYTPYQPEISQGRLEALLNFQTMIESLTGLPIANASLLDEASATAEAVGLMSRAVKKGRRVVLDSRLHPQVLTVAAERARAIDLEVEIVDVREGLVGEDLIGAVIAYTGTEGEILDPSALIEELHTRGALASVVTDPLSLLLLEGPGNLGADIVLGSSQRFGVPLFFGGPHAAYMAVTDKLKRQMPGRIVGVSKDADGRPAYRLALQTREQHIRRERATSNICTAQALLANVASMYAVYHGPKGLKDIAERVHGLASSFAQSIVDAGLEVTSQSFFDTVTVSGVDAQKIKAELQDAGYLVRAIGTDKVSVSFGESATQRDVAHLAEAFGASPAEANFDLPENLQRAEEPLEHEIFHSIHSETQMLRYLRKLADKDLALDRSMIPLGSCTMKLNPTAAMEPISWPEFAGIHPYAPEETTTGWRALVEEIEGWLAELTGYAKVSIQPNAGSQGELAGLLAIRRYHVANGDNERDVVLIPASAHGTNAASATLANLRVAVVKTAEDGSIDVADLEEKIEKHGNHIAGIMVTYPSTHGVFDPEVRDVCDKVHAVGGQVYIDGANMNALTGWARPGDFGGDVSHLNLHKTFTIPHGGGGPGVGPVAVAEHLIPFLPSDAASPELDATAETPVSQGVPITGSKYGSAGVLPISWAYLAMTGAEGLAAASGHAVLGANYLAASLNEYFPVLYTGNEGLVAHECIIDLRELTDASGVTAADVAKRLIDFGFHAPTLAFPVAGTLMIEPTESEDKGELDRFVEAMRTIRAEIQEIIDGEVAYEDSVIHHAPFTAESVATDNWEYSFGRDKAAWPVKSLLHSYKYFPPVRRLDEAYGDRNLVCSCPPPEAFEIDDSEE